VSSQAANVTIDDAVVIITVYNKVSWNPSHVSRLSQHAFLSSQTLQDICRTIPCAPYATRVASHNSIQDHGIEDHGAPHNIICIEGVAYGEGGEDDGSRYLCQGVDLSLSSPTIQKLYRSSRNKVKDFHTKSIGISE
jgi:snRNA-activating protein complex subunit 3